MNRSWIFAAVLAFAASPVFAQQGHDAHHPEPQKQAAGKAAPQGAAGMQASDADFEQHMQKMQALMDKMRAAKSPQERQRLMQQHAELMQEGMQMERMAMADCPMMGKGGVEMMQMMMDHMQQREGMMGQPHDSKMGQGMGSGMQRQRTGRPGAIAD